MTHPVHRVRGFKIVGPHRIEVEFSDGLVRTIDFRPILEGELYGALRDLGVFNAVAIDPDVHTLAWPNGADFDPATLHDWPDHEARMLALAKGWAEATILTADQRAELDRRVAEHLANPASAIPWDEVRRKLTNGT